MVGSCVTSRTCRGCRLSIILVLVASPGGVSSPVRSGASWEMAAGGVGTRRLLRLASGDNYGRPLGGGIDARGPIATVFPDAGGPCYRVLPDGVGSGCYGDVHGDVGATPITGVVAVMIVMRRIGSLVPRGRNNVDVAAIKSAVAGGRGRHGRHGHACRIVGGRRPPPGGGVAMAVGHVRRKNVSRRKENRNWNLLCSQVTPKAGILGGWRQSSRGPSFELVSREEGGRGDGFWKASR